MAARIIVAFDGSELASEAFAYARMLARATGAGILGVHVLEPVPPPIVAETMAGVDAAPAMVEFDDAARKEIEAEEKRFEHEFATMRAACEAESIPFESRIDVGLLVPALIEIAGAEDMIAIGMKGRFARAGLGSSARALIRKAPCPVLVAGGPRRDVNRVLSVFDGSSVSKRAIALARDLSRATNWPHTLLVIGAGDMTPEEAKARAAELAPEAAIVESRPDASEAKQIEEAARHAGDAIIVMGAYPDSWLHQLFFGFGGTTAQVLSKVGAPVLMVH